MESSDDREQQRNLAAYQEAILVPGVKIAGTDMNGGRRLEGSLYGGMSARRRNKGSEQTGWIAFAEQRQGKVGAKEDVVDDGRGQARRRSHAKQRARKPREVDCGRDEIVRPHLEMM